MEKKLGEFVNIFLYDFIDTTVPAIWKWLYSKIPFLSLMWERGC